MAISMLNGSEIMARLRRLARGEDRRLPFPGARAAVGTVALGLAFAFGTMALAPGGATASEQPPREARSTAPPELVDRLTRRGDAAIRAAAVEELRLLLVSEQSADRATGLAALRATADMKVERSALLEPVRDCLSDPSPHVRAAALSMLPLVGGGVEDLATVAELAKDLDAEVLQSLGTSVFRLGPKEGSPERDAIVLTLLNHPDRDVVKEVLRGSWGWQTGVEVETRMVELSREPGMLDDTVYFALSTRPVKSLAVATRLIEVMRLPQPGENGDRAQWGLTHWALSPEAEALVYTELTARYDEISGAYQKSQIIHYLKSRACGIGKAKLHAIAADEEEAENLRKEAREALDRGC
jgi:hypothetical protein